MRGLMTGWYSIGMRGLDMETRTIPWLHLPLIFRLHQTLAESCDDDDPLQLELHLAHGERVRSEYVRAPHSATFGAHQGRARTGDAGARAGSGSVCTQSACVRTGNVCAAKCQVSTICARSPLQALQQGAQSASGAEGSRSGAGSHL